MIQDPVTSWNIRERESFSRNLWISLVAIPSVRGLGQEYSIWVTTYMPSPLGTELLPKTKLTDDLLPRVLALPDYNPEKGKILS